ncbi:MAG: ABC transporter ATP-binding protein [Actinomycetota bacterium]|nr:ABC transporter ATP-binding protein [Actinomycetota bacterium]
MTVTSEYRASALSSRDLVLGYRRRPVVHGVRVELRRGRVTALVGPNGSGKSTLLRALARLHAPSGGEVLLEDGSDAKLLGSRDFARRVTLLSQGRPTPTGISVRDVVGYGRHPYRARWRGTDAEGGDAVELAMRTTGVAELAGACVDELSGGQLQRVWLACCLAQQTGVLLLDEPTTYLDLRYQMEILDLVRDLADQHGVALGVVLHDLDQAAAIADHVVLLDRGRVRASGAPSEVLTSELLSETYGIHVDVDVDPLSGALRTRPVGRHSARLGVTTAVTP